MICIWEGGVPPAVMPAGVFWVAATPPSVPPCVHSLVGVDVLLKGVETRLEVLCCCAVAGVTEGVLRRGGWGVAPATSAVRRHSGSLFWRDNRQSSLLIQKLSEKRTVMRTSSRQPQSTQSCRLRSIPLEHLQKNKTKKKQTGKRQWSHRSLVLPG